MKIKKHTVAEIRMSLLEQLQGLPDDFEVTFGGGKLSLFRCKMRGDKLIDVEFNQVFTVQVDLDEDS